MREQINPSKIARETLRLLATRRITPTPDNYRQHYREVAGEPAATPATDAERMLQDLAAVLRAKPSGGSFAAALEKAALDKDWDRCRGVLLKLIDAKTGQHERTPPWGQLILNLFRQWETRHSALTPAKKRQSLEKVLRIPLIDAGQLATKLENLVNSWSVAALAQPEEPAAARPAAAPTPAQDAVALARHTPAEAAGAARTNAEQFVQLRELLAQTLEFAVMSQLAHAPDLAQEATALARAARAASEKDAITELTANLRQFWFKLEMRGGDNAQLHQGLLRLLRLLIDNTHELLGDDQWLRGQVSVLREIVTRPLDLEAIADAERRLKEVIFKQGTLRASLQEAKAALKQLITSFIDRLGDLSESTDGYHAKLEGYAQQIRQTEDILQLNVVLDELLRDTRTAQINTARTRDELLASRRQVEAAELKVRELAAELEQVSGLVHEDQLTGVLNRRGLENAYQREAARADRAATPMCVSLLDIDNFKHLNDTLGHQTGDEALQHLVRVTKRTMRPTDVLARYGGEEFLLLLPETEQQEAIDVMVRLQRNLTKAFFLHNNERVLITFSAGVARRTQGEPQSAVIDRADKALYQAKRSGKNQVCVA